MLLKVTEIESYYGNSHILHSVSLGVKAGQIVALIGRNGVGKSTTLKSIMGIVSPEKGSILFKKEEIRSKSPFQIARGGIGYVPEERRVFPKLTVRENLIMGMKAGRRKSTAMPWSIERSYEQFPQLKGRDKIEAGSLSGGEQQLLTLARTLMGEPELMLVDEPSEGLSPLLVEVIFKFIEQIHEEGMSMILVDQNLQLICRVSHTVYIMSKGAVVHRDLADRIVGDVEIQKKYLAV